MTIVSGPDKRNLQWASDKSSFGQRMLMKMGWKEGKGLGKNQEGRNTNLRAVKREEGLGIGAKTDTFGDDGFSKTSKNFHGVLANLHAEHGIGKAGGSSSKNESKKSKKSKKKQSKDEGSLTLSQKRVTAGHARKMRESKDLSKKSKEDMAAIFGMKVDDYQNNSVWGRLSSISTNDSTNHSTNDEEKKIDDIDAQEISKDEKKKRRKDKKKRKRNNEENESQENSDDSKKLKKKKKRKDKKS